MDSSALVCPHILHTAEDELLSPEKSISGLYNDSLQGSFVLFFLMMSIQDLNLTLK